MMIGLVPPLKAQDKSLTILSGATAAATAFDVATTMKVFHSCDTCYEANPVMRPFVGSGAGAYTVSLSISSATMWASYKLKQDGRKWWWIPLGAQIGFHLAAGVHNQALAQSRPGF
jgi:hypothetical protein